MKQKRSTLNAQRPTLNSALDVRRWAFDVRLCFDIATKRQQLSPFSVAVVSSFRPRFTLAPIARSICGPRFRVHASANTSRHGLAVLQKLAPAIPKFCCVSSRLGDRSAPRLARSWLLCARKKSPLDRKTSDRSTSRAISKVDRADAIASRRRKVHGACGRDIRFQSAGGHRRSEYVARLSTSFQFANSNRLSIWPEEPLEIRRVTGSEEILSGI
jgi:hypothetical protein